MSRERTQEAIRKVLRRGGRLLPKQVAARLGMSSTTVQQNLIRMNDVQAEPDPTRQTAIYYSLRDDEETSCV